jgi:hypothetical protein
MNNSTWLGTNMKSLDKQALIDPSNAKQTFSAFADTNDGTGTDVPLVASPAAKSYAYAVNTGGATPASCESDDTTCAAYTLTATFEGPVNGASTYAKVNQD